MKLFESILNSLLNESLGEVIVNPNDTSKNVFDYNFTDISNDKRNPEPVIVVYPIINGEDIIKLKQNPETKSLINNLRNKVIPIPLHPETLTDPESNPDEYNQILKICQVINSLGNYGNVDPNEVIKDAKMEFNRQSSLDVKQVKKDEAALWDEFLDNFDTPRVQMLLMSIEKFAGLDGNNGIDWTFSRNNMMKILSQDSKRVAAGKQPATYVAKPQDWRMFNRQIKEDAIPIWLIYRKDPGHIDVGMLTDTMKQNGLPNITRDKALKVHNEMGNDYRTLAKHRFNKYATYNKMDAAGKTLPNGYQWGDYYDVSDTEVIPGLEDKFTKEDRQGFLDNIKLIPTDASNEKFAELNGQKNDYEQTKTEINKLLGVNEGDVEYQKNLNYTYASLYSIINPGNLVSINWDDVINKPTIEDKKRKTFEMIENLAKKQFYGDNANMKLIIPKAQAVACLYVCSHRIAPVYGMSKFKEFKKSADFLANVKEIPINVKTKQRQYFYDYINVYKKICDQIRISKKLVIPYVDKVLQQPQTSTNVVMEESVSKETMMWVELFKEFDNYLHEMGIDKDGNDITGFNISPEAQQISEAKFYSLFNRMNQTRI